MEKPEIGSRLTPAQCAVLFNKFMAEAENEEHVDPSIAFALTLLNYGTDFGSVVCVGDDQWRGAYGEAEKKDQHGIPLCPEGHHLILHPDFPVLGWVKIQ